MSGVIFDFNGTMFFDEKFQNISWRKYLENKIERVVDDNEFNEYVHGRNADFTLSYFLNKKLTRDEIIILEEEKESIYRTMCLESPDFHLACGLAEFLNELSIHKIPITIATASGLKNVKFFFEYLHLDKWFSLDNVAYNDGTVKGKPEPDLYLKAAGKIGVNINECIVFEDAKSGIAAAKRANVKKVIGVASMMKQEDLLSLGADYSIDDYTDLENLMKIIIC